MGVLACCKKQSQYNDWIKVIIEPRCEKTDLRGFRPGPTQIGLYSLKRYLDA